VRVALARDVTLGVLVTRSGDIIAIDADGRPTTVVRS
jgi:hypothetical protein